MTIPLVAGRPVPTWPGERESVGERTLFVRRTPPGDGVGVCDVAVFVHGLGGASTNWTDLMYLLREEVVGVAPDLPGFGFSDPPARGDYSLDGHVRVVTQLVERVSASHAGRPVHLLGNSLGGALATRLTAERPDLVATLTLVSAALPDLRPRRGTDPRLGLFLIPGVASLVNRVTRSQPTRTRAEAVLNLCFADPDALPSERLEESVAELERRRSLPWNEEALVRSLRGLIGAHLQPGPRNLWRQAASIRTPTLVIGGRQDKLVHHAVATRAAGTIPGARLVLLEHCGHVAQMEDPGAVAAAWRQLRDSARLS